MKKILILNGSPRRNGKTASLVKAFIAGAEEAGSAGCEGTDGSVPALRETGAGTPRGVPALRCAYEGGLVLRPRRGDPPVRLRCRPMISAGSGRFFSCPGQPGGRGGGKKVNNLGKARCFLHFRGQHDIISDTDASGVFFWRDNHGNVRKTGKQQGETDDFHSC